MIRSSSERYRREISNQRINRDPKARRAEKTERRAALLKLGGSARTRGEREDLNIRIWQHLKPKLKFRLVQLQWPTTTTITGPAEDREVAAASGRWRKATRPVARLKVCEPSRLSSDCPSQRVRASVEDVRMRTRCQVQHLLRRDAQRSLSNLLSHEESRCQNRNIPHPSSKGAARSGYGPRRSDGARTRVEQKTRSSWTGSGGAGLEKINVLR